MEGEGRVPREDSRQDKDVRSSRLRTAARETRPPLPDPSGEELGPKHVTPADPPLLWAGLPFIRGFTRRPLDLLWTLSLVLEGSVLFRASLYATPPKRAEGREMAKESLAHTKDGNLLRSLWVGDRVPGARPHWARRRRKRRLSS